MEIKKDTHWRTFMETPFIHADELPKEGIVVTIKEVDQTEVYSRKLGKKEWVKIAIFNEIKKPMIFTNRKNAQLEEIMGTGKIAEWIGKPFLLYGVNEKHGGKFGNVLNIKAAEPQKPKEKPVLNEKSANWQKAVDSLKSGATTVEQIKKSYTLDPITEKKMLTLEKAK